MSSLRAADALDQLIARVRAICPQLPMGYVHVGCDRPQAVDARDGGELVWLQEEGYAVLPQVAPDAEKREALIAGVVALLAAELPASFGFLFDPFWEIAETARARVSAMMSTTYLLQADGWIWHVAPGERGWSPHRDEPKLLCDRQRPERLNVWLALTDAGAERSCVHVVPLDVDPHYPSLREGPPPVEGVRAVPVSAGTAVVWNTNLHHWGTTCSRRAVGPRVAVAFTLVRADADRRFLHSLLGPEHVEPRGRLRMLAQVLKDYEDKAPADVTKDVRDWARATCLFEAIAAGRRSGS